MIFFRVISSALISGVLAFGLVACGGGKVEYVDKKDSAQYTSTGLDFHDIEYAAYNSIQNLLKSEFVLSLDINEKKVLAISDVVNDTMQQINVQSLTTKITRAMRNSGRFDISGAVAGSGGMRDNMIDKRAPLRNDAEFDQFTTIEAGTLVAPNLSLSGKITQKNTSAGKKQRVDYSFILQVVDLKTGLVKWDEETNIIKVASDKKVAW